MSLFVFLSGKYIYAFGKLRFAELAPTEAAHVEEFAELIWEVARMKRMIVWSAFESAVSQPRAAEQSRTDWQGFWL